jgi:hypothetical protein
MKWKKILLACLTFVFVFSGVFGFYKEALGTSTSPVDFIRGQGTLEDVQEWRNSLTPEQITAMEEEARAAQEASVAAGTTATPGPTSPEKPKFEVQCSIWNGLDIQCWAAWFSYNIILTIASWIAGVSGLLYDAILQFTVVQMAANFNTNKGFIEAAWIILRDVVNILFLFVLLMAGIMTIIKGFESGTSKKVATVIVVALLINFSMFFTKIVIDASNFIAVEFYNAIVIQNTGSDAWQGIAGVFMKQLSIATIFKTAAEAEGNHLQIIYISLGGSVILLVLAAVLFIASIMFLVRYIILLILLVASSAAIGSWILPSLKKSIFDKWWSALIGQAFFAPVFIFFIYLTLLMTRELAKVTGAEGKNWSSLFIGSGGNLNPSLAIGLVINLLIVLGFLIGSIIVSKKLSGMAGDGAGKMNTLVGGAALGGAALLGRNVIGRSAAGLANSMGEPKGAAGLFLKNRLSGLSKRTYDLRNATGAGSVIGSDFGKGTKNSFASRQKLRDEKAAANAKQISDEMSPDGKNTYRELYAKNWKRKLTGGGGYRGKLIRDDKAKAESNALLARQESEHKMLESQVEIEKNKHGYDHFKQQAEHGEEQLTSLRQALSIAMANGNTSQQQAIESQIAAEKQKVSDSKKEMSRIDQVVNNTDMGGKKISDLISESQAGVAKTKAKIGKIGKDAEVSQKDILKALEKMNKGLEKDK